MLELNPSQRSIVRYLNQIYKVRVIQNCSFIFSRSNAFDKKKLAISIKLSSKTQPLSKINQWRSRYWWDFHVHTTTKLKYLTIFTHVVWKIVVINFPHTAGDFLVCTKCFNINYPLMLSQIEKFPSGSNNFSLVHFFWCCWLKTETLSYLIIFLCLHFIQPQDTSFFLYRISKWRQNADRMRKFTFFLCEKQKFSLSLCYAQSFSLLPRY